MSEKLVPWESFFVAQVGACAALAGLIFVSVSINLERILHYKWLPQRAAQTMVLLGMALILGSITLIPRESALVLGLELGGCALVALILIYLLQRAGGPVPPEYGGHARLNLTLQTIVALLGIVGGALIAAANEAGIFWIASAIVGALVVGIFNAWVLLVEIVR
jgi:modulator of FtsH protease